MNEHDSEKIAGLLSHQGMVPAESLEDADLFILNTCSVREKAAQKVFSRLGEVKRQKKRRQDFIIGVAGCVAQQEGAEITRKAPYVDLVVGTHMYYAIPELIDQVDRQRDGPRVATDFPAEDTPVEIGPIVRQTSFRAAITIMEGCNKHCSFCIVPFTRGKERNRPARLILEEAHKAVDQGFVEILLLGQTVNSYRDPENPGLRFARLLASVAEIPGVRRVRFTSPHPKAFDAEAIAAIASHPTICDQAHLPLQSGSTAVLKRMRRQHTTEWYLDLVERFRSCGRRISLSTDMIVGFPGETEADFEKTLETVRKAEFESMFSFKYSPRPLTEAFEWADDVPDAEKGRRLTALQALQRGIQLRVHRERYLGQEYELLVEGAARDGKRRCGRTTTNKVVNFEGEDPPGSFVTVRISQVGPNSLLGEKKAGAAGAGRRDNGTRV